MPIQINHNPNPLLSGMMSFYGGMAPAQRDVFQAGVQNRALQSRNQNEQFSQIARFLMQQALMEQQAADRRALEQQRGARDIDLENRRLENRKSFSTWQDQQQLEMIGKIENARLDNELIMLERADLPPDELKDAKRDLILQKIKLGERYPRFTPRVVDIEGLPPGFEEAVFAQMTPEGPPVQLQRPQKGPQEVPLEQMFNDINEGLKQRVSVPGGTLYVTPEYKDGRRTWRVNIGKDSEAGASDSDSYKAIAQAAKEAKAARDYVENTEKSGAWDKWFIKDSDKNVNYGKWSGQMVTDPGILADLNRGELSKESARKLGTKKEGYLYDTEYGGVTNIIGEEGHDRGFVFSDFERRPVRPPESEAGRSTQPAGATPLTAPASVSDAEAELSAILDRYQDQPASTWTPEDKARADYLAQYLESVAAGAGR